MGVMINAGSQFAVNKVGKIYCHKIKKYAWKLVRLGMNESSVAAELLALNFRRRQKSEMWRHCKLMNQLINCLN
jgi:hypothetical protein